MEINDMKLKERFHLPYILLLMSIVFSAGMGVAIHGDLQRSGYVEIIALSIFIMGLVLSFWVKKTMLKNQTTLNPYGVPASLIMTGPFSFSRNPMYLSYVMISLAFSLYSQTTLGLLCTIIYFAFINYIVIPMEERKLFEMFGKEYELYSAITRKWI